MHMTEQEYLDYLRRQGMPLDATLTVPALPAMDPASPEGVLEARLRTFAKAAGYLYYHTYNSKRSDPGYVDCTIVHPDGGPLFLWELKSAEGQVSPAQRRWLDALGKVTHVETGVYQPWNWCEITAKLRRPT